MAAPLTGNRRGKPRVPIVALGRAHGLQVLDMSQRNAVKTYTKHATETPRIFALASTARAHARREGLGLGDVPRTVCSSSASQHPPYRFELGDWQGATAFRCGA